MAVLSARARQQLPLHVRPSLLNAEPSRSVLIRPAPPLLLNACRFAGRRCCGSVRHCSVAARRGGW